MGTGNDDAESEEPDVLMAVGPHAEEAMGLQEDQIQGLRSLTGRAPPISSAHLTSTGVSRPRPPPPESREVGSRTSDARVRSLRVLTTIGPFLSGQSFVSAAARWRWIGQLTSPRHVLSDSSKNVGGTRKHSVKHASVDAAHSLGHFCSPRKGSSRWLVPLRARRVTDTRSSGSVHQGGSMAATRRMSAATGAVLPHRS